LCRAYGVAEPEFEISEHWVTVAFPRDVEQATPQVTSQVSKLIGVLQGEMGRGEMLDALGLKDRMHFVDAYLQPAIQKNLVAMTIPDKPRSSKQRYRLTVKGKQMLENLRRNS